MKKELKQLIKKLKLSDDAIIKLLSLKEESGTEQEEQDVQDESDTESEESGDSEDQIQVEDDSTTESQDGGLSESDLKKIIASVLKQTKSTKSTKSTKTEKTIKNKKRLPNPTPPSKPQSKPNQWGIRTV